MPAILIEYLVIAVIILVIGGYFVWQAADRLRYVYGCSDAPPFPCTPEESEKRIQARTTDLTIQFLGTLATVGSLLYITIWKGRRAKLKSH